MPLPSSACAASATSPHPRPHAAARSRAAARLLGAAVLAGLAALPAGAASAGSTASNASAAAQGAGPASATPSTETAAPDASTRVAGLWCGDGLLASFTLRLSQQAQAVSGTIHRREKQWPITGHMEGAVLTTDETPVGSLVLQRDGQALRLVGGKGPIALASGTRFTAAQGGQCGKA